MEPTQIETAAVNATDEALDMWAFVEVMGHSKIAGRLTTRKLGTAVMLQVDVLQPDGAGTAYSKLYSPSSIFSISPVDRAWCARWSQQASAYDFKPVPYIQEAAPQRQLPDASPSYGADDDDDSDERD